MPSNHLSTNIYEDILTSEMAATLLKGQLLKVLSRYVRNRIRFHCLDLNRLRGWPLKSLLFYFHFLTIFLLVWYNFTRSSVVNLTPRFAKDFDANQLKFSSLSQAFLSDLVLNEDVLSNVLELPVWIKLTRAVCNRVSIQASDRGFRVQLFVQVYRGFLHNPCAWLID